jgi:ABC-type phosphate transport system substrate-binding protein
VVAAYNLPSLPNKGLKLKGPILADIFLGKIKKWNDPQIQSINPGVALPSGDIVVVHRSDGSGTTFVWTSCLSKISPSWNSTVGKGKSVQWPIGIGPQEMKVSPMQLKVQPIQLDMWNWLMH